MRSWTLFLLAGALAAQTPSGEVTTREETPTFQSSVNLVRAGTHRPVHAFRQRDARIHRRRGKISRDADEDRASGPTQALPSRQLLRGRPIHEESRQ